MIPQRLARRPLFEHDFCSWPKRTVGWQQTWFQVVQTGCLMVGRKRRNAVDEDTDSGLRTGVVAYFRNRVFVELSSPTTKMIQLVSRKYI